MGLFDRFFKKQIDNAITEKASLLFRSQLNEALYFNLSSGVKLFKDTSLKEILEAGYENNPDLFGIINTISLMASNIPLVPYRGEVKSEIDPFELLFENNQHDYTFHEFRKEWHDMAISTGESIINFETLKGGNNQGKLTFAGIMPSQNVEIKSKGWRQPVGFYQLDMDNEKSNIPPENVIHTRIFRNILYENGKNFRGISPIRVAYKLVSSQNNSYDLLDKTFNTPMPPSIIYEKGDSSFTTKGAGDNTVQQTATEERWRNKSRKNKGEPYFTNKEIGKIDLGYQNLRDLAVVEVQNQVKRAMCTALGVPAEIFGDNEHSTYNNKKEAEKALYINRILPDVQMFCNSLNKIIKGTGIEYRINVSDIDVLHESRGDISKRLLEGVKFKTVYVNEWRESEGLEALTPKQLEELEMQGLTMPSIEDTNRILEDGDVE